MSEVLKNILNKFCDAEAGIDTDLQAREAQRLYYAARLETYEEQLRILRVAETEAIKSRQWEQSPFMFGYVAGLRTAIAFAQGFKVRPLPKPDVWHNDPNFTYHTTVLHRMRRDMRRDITRLLWIIFDDERKIRTLLKAAMRAFPPMYKVRLERKRRIEESGANYEEVTNAKNIESWWT